MSKIKTLTIGFAFLGLVLAPAGTLAIAPTTTSDSGTPVGNSSPSAPATTSLPSENAVQKKLDQNPIVNDINDFVTFLTGLVGVVCVGAIIVGGIQYTAAGGNPQALASARKRIANALLALVAFLLIWAFVQWLVPGGVFG